MLLKLSKNNLPFQYVLLTVFSLVLWGKTFIATGFSDIGCWLSWGLCLFLSIGFGLLAAKQNISRNPGLLGSVFLCLLGSQIQTDYTPDLWAYSLFLLSFHCTLNIYGKEHPYPAIFNAVFCWSAATLFFPGLLFTLPCFWVILLIYAVGNWRVWATSLIGMGTPYLLMFLYDFLFHRDTLTRIWSESLVFGIPTAENLHLFPDLLLLFGMAVSLFSIFSLRQYLQGLEITERRKSSALIALFFYLSVFTLLTSGHLPPAHRFPLLIPLAFFCTKFIWFSKNAVLKESVFGIILALSVCAMYF